MDTTREQLCLLSALDAKALSYIYLGGNAKKLSKEELRRICAKKLIEVKNDSSYTVKKECLPVVSDYPLFGEYKKTKTHPVHLLPFLFGLIAEGYVSSDQNKAQSYLYSDYFTSLFPAGEAFSKGAVKALSSLVSLSLVYSDSAHFKLHRENILRFNELSEESKLSYLIKPHAGIEERERLTNAISLAFRLRKIKDLVSAFNLIKAITGFDLKSVEESLFDLAIIYSDEDGFEGYELDAEEKEKPILSSDYTLSYAGFSSHPLFLFLKPIKTDIITQWLIDKNTMRAAFSMNYTPSDILTLLDSITQYGVPETIKARIESWYEQYRSIIVQRALILVVDEKNSRILDNLPLLQIHILSKPASNVFIMNPDTEEEWRKILTYSGYDMLGSTMGPVFTDFPLSYPFIETRNIKSLSREREIKYDSKRINEMIEEASSPIEKTLISLGVIDSAPLLFVEGLFFQEKMRMMQDAIKDERTVIAIDIDDNIEVYKPTSITKDDDDSYVSTNIGIRNIDKIWKLAILPEYVIAGPLSLLDSDNQ